MRGEGVKLVIQQEDMKDIIKIMEALENSGILLKGVIKQLKMKLKNKEEDF